MRNWIKTRIKAWWRRLFPVRQGLDAEQTRRFEEMLAEMAALHGRYVHQDARQKIRVLQLERQRLRRVLTFYAKKGTPREPALEALKFQGDDPILWTITGGYAAMDAYAAIVAGDE